MHFSGGFLGPLRVEVLLTHGMFVVVSFPFVVDCYLSFTYVEG